MVPVCLKFPKPKRTVSRGCRCSDRAEDLKAIRGYTDPRTFCRRDGSEVLHGADWKKRKEELWERCGGQCEYIAGGIRCRESCADPHHTTLRSKRRDDNLSALQALCRPHHSLLDRRVPWPEKRN